MKPRIGQIIVFVSDMQRSINFYRDLLGLELTSESEQWSEFTDGERTMALHYSNAREEVAGQVALRAGRAELVMEVEDIFQACAEIIAKGGAVDGPKRLEGLDLQVAFLRDPDGMAIELVSAERSG